jgi:cytochrome c biogenesis protein CcdA/thiol-disulfide isomerase/thioredoxin/DsbC/DsbD-like thiol-disulfide interchange protein
MRNRSRLASLVVFLALLSARLPAQAPAKAELTPLVETEAVTPGSEIHVALKVQLPEGYHMNSNKPRDPMLIPVVLSVPPTADQQLPAGITVSEIVFPTPTDLKQRGSDQPLSVFERDFAIGVVLKIASDAPRGKVTVPARLRYQACDETMCYIPTRAETGWEFTVGSSRSAATHQDVFGTIAFGKGEAPAAAAATPAVVAPGATAAGGGSARPAAGGEGDEIAALDGFVEQGTTFGYLGSSDFLTFIKNAENGVREKGMLEGRGPLAILLLVLVGGLALNLTPCVLPMIPINLAIIGAGAQAGSRQRGFLLGLAYGAAMAAVYGVLGLIVVLTAGSFGTINASPWFNLGIAILFVILAIAMFDVINIDFSKYSGNLRSGGSQGSVALAFTMGGVAALLAGACVAPVVIQVVLFSSNLYAAGTTAALALPFVLGVGMAIPWPIAGAGIAALPRPGAWMTRIKQAFGVIILGTAIYYGYEAYSLFSNRWVDASEVSSSVEEKLKEGWQPSLVDGLALARRENKPVLIDMWATWCKNCLVMDKTTLEDPAVNAALSNYVKIKYQAEDPDDPRVAKVMQYMKTSGLPTYVIMKPKP